MVAAELSQMARIVFFDITAIPAEFHSKTIGLQDSEFFQRFFPPYLGWQQKIVGKHKFLVNSLSTLPQQVISLKLDLFFFLFFLIKSSFLIA